LRIDYFIQSARDKLRVYDSRMSVVNRKVDTIKGFWNKATKIFSSVKYPVGLQQQKDVAELIALSKWQQLYVSSEVVNMKHKLHKYKKAYTPFDQLAYRRGIPSV
jgi:hypothetical protein